MTKVKVTLAPDTKYNVEQFLKNCGINDYKNLGYYFPILVDCILGDCVTMTQDNQDLVETMLGAEACKG